jgi:hypothetical protein
VEVRRNENALPVVSYDDSDIIEVIGSGRQGTSMAQPGGGGIVTDSREMHRISTGSIDDEFAHWEIGFLGVRGGPEFRRHDPFRLGYLRDARPLSSKLALDGPALAACLDAFAASLAWTTKKPDGLAMQTRATLDSFARQLRQGCTV